MSMNFDIAGLQFAINSDQAATGADNLNRLSDAADRAQRSHDSLITTHQRFIAVANDLGTTLAEQRRQFQETQATIEQQILVMERLRDATAGAARSIAEFGAARMQVEAIGAPYGQTSTGVESYFNRAQMFGLTPGESTLGLSRITDAINNTDPAGTALRNLFRQSGVNVGNDPNQAGQVLQQLYWQLQQMQDGQAKQRLTSELLGPLAPGDYASFTAPAFQSFEQQRSMSQGQQSQQTIAETTRNAMLRSQQSDLRDQRWNAETSRYDIGYLASDQIAQLAAHAGVSVDQIAPNLLHRMSPELFGTASVLNFRSQGQTQATYDWLGAHPNDPLAQDARGWSGFYGDAINQGFAGRADRYWGAGYRANVMDINARFDEDRQQHGWFGAVGRQLTYGLEAYVPGGYTSPAVPDDRRQSPLLAALTNTDYASILSGYGDKSLSNQQYYNSRVADLPDRQRMLEQVYGATEGDARLAQMTRSNQLSADRAMTPGGDTTLDAQLRGLSGSMGPIGGARMEQLLSFMKANNIDPAMLVGSGVTSASSAAQRFLTPGQLSGFGAYQGAAADAQTGTAHAQAQFEIEQQRELGQAARGGAQALAEFRSGLMAANQASRVPGANVDLARSDAYRLFEQTTLSGQQGELRTAQMGFGISRLDAGNTAALHQGDILSQMINPSADFVKRFTEMGDAIVHATAAAAQMKFTMDGFQAASSSVGAALNTQFLAGLPASQRAGAQITMGIVDQRLSDPNAPVLDQHGRPMAPVSTALAAGIRGESAFFPGIDPGMVARIGSLEEPIGGGLNPFQIQGASAPTDAMVASMRVGRIVSPGSSDPADQAAMAYAHLAQTQQQLRTKYPNSSFAQSPFALALGYRAGTGDPSDPGNPLTMAFASGNVQGLSAEKLHYATEASRMPGYLPFAARSGLALTDPGTTAQIDAAHTELQANQEFEAQKIAEETLARSSTYQAQLAFLRTGQTGNASFAAANYSPPGTPPGVAAAQAAQRATFASQQTGTFMATQEGSSSNQIRQAHEMATAWAQGYAEVERVTAAQQAHNEVLGLHFSRLKDGTTAAQQAAQAEATLTKEKLDSVAASRDAAMAQAHFTSGQAIDASKFNIGLGIGTPTSNAFAMSQYQTQQSLAAQHVALSDPRYAQAMEDAKNTFVYDQQVQGLDRVRNAAAQMGDAVLGSFQRLTRGGESFKHALGDLALTISGIIEDLAFKKPLENLFSGAIGSVLPGSAAADFGSGGASGLGIFGLLGQGINAGSTALGFGNIFNFGAGSAAGPGGDALFSQSIGFGGVGDVAASTGGLSLTDLTGIWGGYATGGVFDRSGPVRMHASGSVINTPTPFRSGDGGRNIAGEAGPEAILPLQRMPNGNLGVAVAGAGAGMVGQPNLTIHAPIIMQNSGQGGGMDAGAMEGVRNHLVKMVRETIQGELLMQSRMGGMLHQFQTGALA